MFYSLSFVPVRFSFSTKSAVPDLYLMKVNVSSSHHPVVGLTCARFFAALWTVAHQAPLNVEFSRQEHWSGCYALLQGSSQPRDGAYLFHLDCTG